jgi:hypothetical protein
MSVRGFFGKNAELMEILSFREGVLGQGWQGERDAGDAGGERV